MSIIFCGCNTEEGIGVESSSVKELKEIVSSNLNGLSQVTPEVALKSITELYERNNSNKIVSNEKPIELYLTYGTDYWTESHYESSKTFEMTFAHQVVERADSVLYEYSITLVYSPEEFNGIDEFTLKYESNAGEFSTFKKTVIQSEGFQKASLTSPIKVKIVKEEI